MLSRFADVFAAARDTATFSSAQGLTFVEDERRKAGLKDVTPLVMLDPPAHTAFRRLVARGFAHLERSADGDEMSTYHVQASIAAVHAGAATPGETRWPAILALYDDLVALNPSPVVRLNRVVALSKVEGPAPALAGLADIEREPALASLASVLPGDNGYSGGRQDNWGGAGGKDDALAAANAVAALQSYGSGGKAQVAEQLARWKQKLGQ